MLNYQRVLYPHDSGFITPKGHFRPRRQQPLHCIAHVRGPGRRRPGAVVDSGKSDFWGLETGKIAVLWWKNGCVTVEKWLCYGGKMAVLRWKNGCFTVEKWLFYGGKMVVLW